jgi:carbonic anhydrase/acetyltransferase-like protein (isoleucine patch superfamily)
MTRNPALDMVLNHNPASPIPPFSASFVAFFRGSRMLHQYKGITPKLGERVYLAPSAEIIGDVEIGDHSSVWYNCVIRGDVHYIRIGHHTNIQDGSICHVMKDEYPLIVGDHVTIGHGVMLHGCTIESHCLIGMRATILNNASVGAHSIVAAGALLTEGFVVPPRSLVMGMPAKVKRELSDNEVANIDEYARRYFEYKETYLNMKG